MKPHTRIYFNYFNIAYNESGWHDYIACEIPICPHEAVDIHHINGRGKEEIEDLIALCRICHMGAHKLTPINSKLLTKESLQEIHNRNLKTVNKN